MTKRPHNLLAFELFFYASSISVIAIAFWPKTHPHAIAFVIDALIITLLVLLCVYGKSRIARALLILSFISMFINTMPVIVYKNKTLHQTDLRMIPLTLQSIGFWCLLQKDARAWFKKS